MAVVSDTDFWDDIKICECPKKGLNNGVDEIKTIATHTEPEWSKQIPYLYR